MLVIVHLIDSRKSYLELTKYFQKVTRMEGIEHWFVFGGDRNFNASISEDLIRPEDRAWIWRDEFYCAQVINKFIKSPEFKGYLTGLKMTSPDDDIFVNVRDMDDEYDDEQMLKDSQHRENVGVIRFNYKTKVNGEFIEQRYGGFLGDYCIKGYFKTKFAPKEIISLQSAILNEPHMIHRQFALVNAKVIEKMANLPLTYNKGEDTLFLANAYITSMNLGMYIVVAGSVDIGIYNRDESTMTGNAQWLDRFLSFTDAITQGMFELSERIKVKDGDYVNMLELLKCIEYERIKGNASSYRYHMEIENEKA